MYNANRKDVSMIFRFLFLFSLFPGLFSRFCCMSQGATTLFLKTNSTGGLGCETCCLLESEVRRGSDWIEILGT
jgi:hypothetical protein